MTPAELVELLDQLRATGSDHQFVEAKKATRALPESTHETISAFANSEGGMLILGVDEGEQHQFDVTGVEDAGQMQSNLQSLCGEMEPAVRAVVSILELDSKNLLVAEIPSTARHLRPCHRRHEGEHAGSFVRVGDGDRRMTRAEVDELLMQRASHDDCSARAAPAAVRLNEELVEEFLGNARRLSGNEDFDDPALLHRYHVETPGENGGCR